MDVPSFPVSATQYSSAAIKTPLSPSLLLFLFSSTSPIFSRFDFAFLSPFIVSVSHSHPPLLDSSHRHHLRISRRQLCQPYSPIMRVFTSLTALVAGTVVQHASAQADYGTHGGNWGNSPNGNGNSAGLPAGSPNGGPSGDPNGNAYGNPSGNSNGSPASVPGNLPGTTPDMSTCALQVVTTVFVTVYPTSHLSPSGVVQPSDFDPDQSIHQTVFPTTHIPISSAESVEAAHTSVKPFTTLTIDVWGSDPDSSNAFPSDDPSAPIYTDGASDPAETSADFPDGFPSQTPWPSNLPASEPWEHPTPSDGQSSFSAGPVVGSPTAIPPENSAYGNGDDFPNISSNPNGGQPSEYSSPTGTGAGGNDNHPIQVTVIGSDGKPTVLEFPGAQPSNGNGNGAGQPFPTVTAPISGFTPGGASVTSGVLATAGETMCTSYTIIGPNGVPTVVHSTWVDFPTATAGFPSGFLSGLPSGFPSSLLSGLPSGFPSGFPSGLPSGFPSSLLSGLPTNPSVITGLPGGPVIATHTEFTVLGPDGLPTVIESSWLVPAPTNTQLGISGPNSVGGFPNQVTGIPTQTAGTAAGVSVGGSSTCTSYTVLGPDGLPTVIGTTWVVSNPTAGGIPANVVTGVPSQVNGVSGFPSQLGTNVGGANAVTTCTSYTVLGPDGVPTVVESTFVVLASSALPAVTNGPPLPPAQASGFPQGTPNLPDGGNFATTCITVGVIGPDGFTTPAIQTIVIPTSGLGNALPAQTNLGYPSLVPAQTGLPLPQGGLSATPAGSGLFTTCITVTTLGPDGMATPVVQTIVGLPSGADLGAPSGSLINLPTLTQYGSFGTGLPVVLPPSAVVSGLAEPTGTVTGTRTSTFTVTNGPDGRPASLIPYSDEWNNQAPVLESSPPSNNAYGSLPTGPSHLATALQTSTWTNVIPEQTTTYTINFPLTTMATVTLPNRRVMRRQQESVTSEFAWDNSSATLSFPAFSTPSPFTPVLPSVTDSVPPQASAVDGSDFSPMCPTGGKIGNFTLDFDDTKAGPLFNPSRDIWFSQGFLIAPPSSQTSQSYNPSSGGQLVEFMPPSLPLSAHSNAGDTAEIGVGPNAPNHCFRFDFQGASLGCAAEGAENWCDFEVSAYRYNDVSQREESIAWSETKHIPACPNFPHGNCRLTPVSFDGYTNITSILINLRVGNEVRVWWGDDFKFGWSDNGCDAAACRANALPQPVKREAIESAARQGVWHWTPRGLKRLDDGYIWESV